jgi:O-succinylhomoserine sulfhydrylase
MKFETKAIRIQNPKSDHREHSSAIFPTSSFLFNNAEQMQAVFGGTEAGNIYSRFTNPSVSEFEEKIAALEGVEKAMATASGMAAVFASFLAFLKSGDHLIATRAIFGSTYQVLSQTLAEYGIEVSFVDGTKPEEWPSAMKKNTKMFYLETPSNPGLEIVDLSVASEFCKANKILLSVDNCFATPYLQQPAKFGADLVIHSATKFIDGQGRVLGGAVAGSKEIIEKIYMFIRRTGASLSPFNAWVLSKSLETLAVRMDRHCDNAYKLAQWLLENPKAQNVKYPFLQNHPQYKIAKQQLKLGGGIVTFQIEGGNTAGTKFLNALQMISLTANLGDAKTIASHPASTTHLRVPEADRLKVGITDGLVRISVGLEHIDDIIEDIRQALNTL